MKGFIKNNPAFIKAGIFLAELSAGFVFSGTQINGAAAFADISAAGAAGLAGSAAVLTGSLLHCFLSGTIGRNIVKLSAMVLILIAKLLMDNKKAPKLCGIYTALSVFLSGTAVSAVIGELPYKLIFYVFYSSVAGFTAYSLAGIAADIKKEKAIDISSAAGCYYAVVYIIYTASLCSVKIPIINIGIIIGLTVTILFSHYYGYAGGVLCGALTSCAAFLSSSETGMTVVLLPAAGLFTGYVRSRRIHVTAFIFCFASFMLMVLTGLTQNSIFSMINIISAAGIFIAAGSYYSGKRIILSNESMKEVPEVASVRLRFMSDSIGRIREETSRLSEMIMRRSGNGTEQEDEIRKVCDKCYRRHLCRRKGSTSMKGLDRLAESPEISQETFPVELDTCIRRSELIKARERMIRSDTVAKLMEMRISDCRGLLNEQMKMAEELIMSAGRQPEISFSAAVSMAVREKLVKFGFLPSYVIACYNRTGRLLIEIYFEKENTPASSIRVCDLVSDELRMKLSCCEPLSSGKQFRLRLFEKPKFTLEVYISSRNAEGAAESGDTSAFFTDGTGMGYVVLSDGMGSGKEASFESGLVVSLFKKLICSGMEINAAIKLINSIMLTKSKEENFATLDILRIDLDNCGMMVVKSGAAATLVRHGRGIKKLSAVTFPIGICEKSEMFETECDFEEGDIAIMFSDGINEGEYPFIKELLLSGNDLRSIVEEICAKAEKFTPAERTDDITVIGIRAVSA